MEDFGALLDSGVVNERTREVLQARLLKPAITEPRFFSAAQFATLRAVCARLIPQPENATIDLPGLLDGNMKSGTGKGWRYANMPSDMRTLAAGLKGIEQTTHALMGADFASISEAWQNDVLRIVQGGNPPGEIWTILPAARFFEELLTALVELYYSHPIAKAQIGDISFADAQGWVRIGLHQQRENQLTEAKPPSP